jgi:hypothetical protein
MKFSRRDVLRRVSIFSVEDFAYCHKRGITWNPLQNCLKLSVIFLTSFSSYGTKFHFRIFQTVHRLLQGKSVVSNFLMLCGIQPKLLWIYAIEHWMHFGINSLIWCIQIVVAACRFVWNLPLAILFQEWTKIWHLEFAPLNICGHHLTTQV